VVVTTLVPVDAVAGVAPAGDAAVPDEVDAAGEAVAAGDAVAAVEFLVAVPDAVEPEDVVPSVPAVAAIPKAAARNPPIDRRAAATLVRLAGWRRRVVR
jgi:hypothetical protein